MLHRSVRSRSGAALLFLLVLATTSTAIAGEPPTTQEAIAAACAADESCGFGPAADCIAAHEAAFAATASEACTPIREALRVDVDCTLVTPCDEQLACPGGRAEVANFDAAFANCTDTGTPVPAGWTCEIDAFLDGRCDCDCGGVDAQCAPDCEPAQDIDRDLRDSCSRCDPRDVAIDACVDHHAGLLVAADIAACDAYVDAWRAVFVCEAEQTTCPSAPDACAAEEAVVAGLEPTMNVCFFGVPPAQTSIAEAIDTACASAEVCGADPADDCRARLSGLVAADDIEGCGLYLDRWTAALECEAAVSCGDVETCARVEGSIRALEPNLGPCFNGETPLFDRIDDVTAACERLETCGVSYDDCGADYFSVLSVLASDDCAPVAAALMISLECASAADCSGIANPGACEDPARDAAINAAINTCAEIRQPAPVSWTCAPGAYFDATCDCDCGDVDFACTAGACDPAGEGEGEGEGEDPGEGEGEGEPGEGEGEGEGEPDDGDGDGDGDGEGCAATSTSMTSVLALLGLMLGRRRHARP